MCADRLNHPPLTKREAKDVLNDVVDFGSESESTENENIKRIKRIMKKLQEISRRIDYLASQL